jgi:hypothetical protein
LKEGSTETKDKDTHRSNITAAKLVTEMVKSSLGPRGMDKMLVDTLGDITKNEKNFVNVPDTNKDNFDDCNLHIHMVVYDYDFVVNCEFLNKDLCKQN